MSVPNDKTSTPGTRTNPVNYITSPIVKLLVGKDKKEFLVHKALLTGVSSYFRACFKPGFEGAESLEINMEDDDEPVVYDLVSWLYKGQIPSLQTTHAWLWRPVIAFYRLADKLDITSLQNDIVDGLDAFRPKDVYYSVRGACLLAECGLLGTRLGQLLVRDSARVLILDISSWPKPTEQQFVGRVTRWSEQILQGHISDDASAEVLETIFHYRQSPSYGSLRKGVCDYHIHPDGKLCKRG